MTQTILLLGGDQRQEYLAAMLSQLYSRVRFLNTAGKNAGELEEETAKADLILLPLPFSKDQKTLFFSSGTAPLVEDFLSWLHPGQQLFGWSPPPVVRDFCRENHIFCHDFSKDPEVIAQNAKLTAEGALCTAIANSPGALCESLCLVTGWGHCGSALALMLKGMGASVIVSEIDPEKRRDAQEKGVLCLPSLIPCDSSWEESQTPLEMFDYLFNTVPCPIFSQKLLSQTSPRITIIDLASAPGGVDFEFCRLTGRKALAAPGLPGRFCPKAAADILLKQLIPFLNPPDLSSCPQVP